MAWSQISHGILAWGITVTKRLEAVQHRIVTNMYGSSSLSVYQSRKILPFEETHDFFALVKFFNGFNNVDESSYFNERLHNLQTKQSYNNIIDL